MQAEWMEEEGERIGRMDADLEAAKRSLKEEEEELAKVTLSVEYALQAQKIITGVAESVQRKAHERISAVVSTCLGAVFEDPYELKIHFEQKRGRTEARLRFARDGFEIDPVDASGGGAVDVAAFALRAICLVLHRPPLQRVLFLDEPFKFVSEGYQPAIKQMLEQLSRDLKLQIIMVTHNENYETGKVVEL